MSEYMLHKNHNIPIHVTDVSIFNDSYSDLREKFVAEMQRMEDEMKKFSTNLHSFYATSTPGKSGATASKPDRANEGTEGPHDIKNIFGSPLIQDDGNKKTLKLQFDVSQFDPSEVNVQILSDILIISAKHEEMSDSSAAFREYHRQFLLPKGTDPEAVVSNFSREGILTVDVPFLLPAELEKEGPAI